MLPKACKNEIELTGMRAAHLRDGVAMTRFLAWLDRLVASGEFEGVDEGTLADQVEAFRREQEHYVEPSFDTISALGPNAAMCHYHHTNGTPVRSVRTAFICWTPAPSIWMAPPTSPAPSRWVR